MAFRRVNAEQYVELFDFCMKNDINFELKTLDKTTLLFGLDRQVWHAIDYGALACVKSGPIV